MTTSTTINVTEGNATLTPGNFSVRAFYTETDAGHVFGTFASRERAEECLVTLAARPTVIKATIEEAV